ncbi:hypothetical protein COSO111634_33825 [Corallococcus soli]
MVEHQPQHVLLRAQPHQVRPHHRARRQVERDVGELPAAAQHPLLALFARVTRDLLQRHGQISRRVDHLHRAAIGQRVRGAQHFVPLHQLVQRGLEGLRVQRAGEPEVDGVVVGDVRRIQLLEVPEPLLREGERQRLCPRRAGDGRRSARHRRGPLRGRRRPGGGLGGRARRHGRRQAGGREAHGLHASIRAQARRAARAVQLHGPVQRMGHQPATLLFCGSPQRPRHAGSAQGQLTHHVRGHRLARVVQHPDLEARRDTLAGGPGQQRAFDGAAREQHLHARGALQRGRQLRRRAFQDQRPERRQRLAGSGQVRQRAGQPRRGVQQHGSGLARQLQQLAYALLTLHQHLLLPGSGLRLRQGAHLRQPAQALQHHRRLQAEVDEARHLVHVRGAHVAQPLQPAVHRADEARHLRVMFEGVLQEHVQVLRGELVDLPLVTLRRQQRRGDVRGAAEVAQQGLAHDAQHLLLVVAQVRVQHAGDVAPARVPVAAPRLAVQRHLRLQLLQRVREEAGEDARAQLAREPEGLRVGGGGEPHRQLLLDGLRTQAHLHHGAVAARTLQLVAPPQRAQRLQVLEQDVAAIRVVLRREGEVPHVPAGGHRHVHASAGQVVHHGPLFGDEQRIMQRQHHAAGAQAHVARDGGHRRGHDGRLRVDATKRVEVPLGRPYGREAVRVRELRALHQQLVLRAAHGVLVIGEVAQAHVERARTRAPAVQPHELRRHLLGGEDHAQAARERPQRFQLRPLRRGLGGREPGAALGGTQARVQPGEQLRQRGMSQRPRGLA